MAAQILLLPLLTLLFFLGPLTAGSSFDGARIELARIDSDGNYTVAERIGRALARDKLRLARFDGMRLDSQSKGNFSSPVHSPGFGEYIMELSIGTPPVPFFAIADTGSDLIWIQCEPCNNCTDLLPPKYDPSKSSTVSTLPCSSSLCQALDNFGSCSKGDCFYDYTYGLGETIGQLDSETFTLGSPDKPVSVPNIGFGCSSNSNFDFFNSSGLVGLARGNLSLVSQLGVGKFSYCLTSRDDTTSTSPLFLGPLAALTGAIKSTLFAPNPPEFPSFYYLSLKGISIGTTLLPISSTAFSLRSNGTGGLIIDSGTTLTYLVDQAYQVVKQSIESVVTLPIVDGSDYEFDLCFALPSGSSSPPQTPNLVFHFDGADMEVPQQNYMIGIPKNRWCLTILSSTFDFSILGNIQQQNMHILYDLDNKMLSFAPAQCNKI